jgi:tripartite ATP-independent transporter DctM subunit
MTAFKEGVWALFLPFIIIFGLKFGIFTPTEAGCVAAVYSLFVAIVVYRELQWHAIFHVFVTAAKTTSVVMFLVGAAMVSAWLVTVADVPGQLAAVLQPFLDSPLLLMVLIMGVIVTAGMFMDMTPNILILAPVLMPLVQQAGIDPVYFGVLFVINTSIGLITPPVGTVLNVVSAVGKIQLGELVVGVMPFLVAEVIVLALMILFPALVTVPAHWFY